MIIHQLHVSPKLQDCIGVAYTPTQSILELFKLEANYLSTSCFTKSEKLQKSCTYTANQSTLELFKLEVDYVINFVSPKLQDCIGVAYTAIQSILQLFKLEVNYSSISFQQNCKIA